MNIFQAKCVLRCRSTLQARNVWLDFTYSGCGYSYGYVVNTLSQLSALGLLVKREINNGERRGRKTFYTATPEGITEASNVIETQVKSIQADCIVDKATTLDTYVDNK
jgi:DNA-binding PadR family transcriptional regulator